MFQFVRHFELLLYLLYKNFKVNNESNHRRQFLKTIAAFSTVSIIDPEFLNALSPGNNLSEPGLTILFQGDSITDGNRTRNNDWNHIMGHGFAYIIASRLWYDYPDRNYHFLNRGISGNKVPDLLARWQKETVDLKPDILSILIGINDISALVNGNNAFTAQQFETDYRTLLQQTVRQLPGIQLVLCEPFILPVGNVKDKWEMYAEEIDKRRNIVSRLSIEFNTVLVKFQDAFNKALKRAPAEYWIWDGVHPMPAGHELMAREWIKQVGKKIKNTKQKTV